MKFLFFSTSQIFVMGENAMLWSCSCDTVLTIYTLKGIKLIQKQLILQLNSKSFFNLMDKYFRKHH